MRYSVDDVSRFFDVNPETVRRWIRANKMKATLRGGRAGGYIIDDFEIVRFSEKYNKKVSGVTVGDIEEARKSSVKKDILDRISILEKEIMNLKELVESL